MLIAALRVYPLGDLYVMLARVYERDHLNNEAERQRALENAAVAYEADFYDVPCIDNTAAVRLVSVYSELGRDAEALRWARTAHLTLDTDKTAWIYALYLCENATHDEILQSKYLPLYKRSLRRERSPFILVVIARVYKRRMADGTQPPEKMERFARKALAAAEEAVENLQGDDRERCAKLIDDVHAMRDSVKR